MERHWISIGLYIPWETICEIVPNPEEPSDFEACTFHFNDKIPTMSGKVSDWDNLMDTFDAFFEAFDMESYEIDFVCGNCTCTSPAEGKNTYERANPELFPSNVSKEYSSDEEEEENPHTSPQDFTPRKPSKEFCRFSPPASFEAWKCSHCRGRKEGLIFKPYQEPFFVDTMEFDLDEMIEFRKAMQELNLWDLGVFGMHA